RDSPSRGYIFSGAPIPSSAIAVPRPAPICHSERECDEHPTRNLLLLFSCGNKAVTLGRR
ncbi:MAG: hypothetical protein WA855_05470, partial [Candidatus Acidiferrales bacterium]